jgi:hypothetical protein
MSRSQSSLSYDLYDFAFFVFIIRTQHLVLWIYNRHRIFPKTSK